MPSLLCSEAFMCHYEWTCFFFFLLLFFLVLKQYSMLINGLYTHVLFIFPISYLETKNTYCLKRRNQN